MKNKYFTERERYQLEVLLKQGYKPKELAPLFHKCLATIYNEIKRGSVTLLSSDLVEYTAYCADVAQRKYEYNRTAKGRDLNLGNDYSFVSYVSEQINKYKLSPQAVLYNITLSHKQFKCKCCKTTLYNYIKKGLISGVAMSTLPMPRKTRNNAKIRRSVALKNIMGRSIENRPKDINKRLEFGHWEMDTVVSGHYKSGALLVLTERKTRLEEVFKLKSKSSAEVIKALDSINRRIGTSAFRERYKTITCDNGVEFLDYKKIERSIYGGSRTKVYYCHPFCSSERGSNENHNRFIRRWIPKGANISKVPISHIRFIQEWINNYPRPMFGGLSSAQVANWF